MGYQIINPKNSFVQFGGTNLQHCIFGEINICLPVYTDNDIAFQFVLQADTPEEISLLCDPSLSGISIGLVRICGQAAFDIEFTEMPDRYKISSLQVLFNWPHGMPGMIGEMDVNQCFYIRVSVDGVNYCSNCFQRILDDCFTSVLEYGNDDNFADFNYCNSESINIETSCDPEVIEFTNKLTLTIPYTASMQNKYGTVPTVQVWIYDGAGILTNMGVVATFDAMPPNFIYVDLGGLSSGIIVIR